MLRKTQTSIFTLALQQCVRLSGEQNEIIPTQNIHGVQQRMTALNSELAAGRLGPLTAPERSDDTEYEDGPVRGGEPRLHLSPPEVVWVSDACTRPPQFRFTTGRWKMCRPPPDSNSYACLITSCEQITCIIRRKQAVFLPVPFGARGNRQVRQEMAFSV